MVVKNSFRSQTTLLIGLAILILAIITTLFTIKKLERAVSARKVSFEILDDSSSLENNIETWIIDKNEMAQSPERTEKLKEIETQINFLFGRLQQTLGVDPEQMRLLKEVEEQWKTFSSGPHFHFSEIEKMDQIIKKIDHLEEMKMEAHQKNIVKSTHSLLLIVSFSVLLAILMIVISLLIKNYQDINRNRLIEQLTNLGERAESASRLKSKFLSTVSHEIRTPLNGIIGLSDVLLRGNISLQDKYVIKMIHQSGHTLLKIINDILDYSKIEAGRLELEDAEFSIIDVFNQVCVTLMAKASKKFIHLTYQVDPNIPQSVFGDSGRLTQILFNLVGNAIKFTSKGEVTVSAKLLEFDNSEASIEFSVRDTGSGMSEEEQKMLFTPFLQGKKVGTMGEPGTGLGLTICQQIVKAMGGEIQFESRLGEGTRFWFTVRLKTPSQTRVGVVSETLQSESEPKTYQLFKDDKKPRVLVVEDNPTNQIVAQTMLLQLGADVVLAGNGHEAIEILSNSSFDLIFMDCQMPEMDGFEATEKIRFTETKVPVIAMTANASQEDQKKCFMAGMNGVLLKPFSFTEIAQVLKKYLSHFLSSQSTNLEDLRMKLGPTAVERIINSYLATLPELSRAVHFFNETKDIDQIKHLAHRFKSSSLLVGQLELSQLCEKMENAEGFVAIDELRKPLLEQIQLATIHLQSHELRSGQQI